MKNKDSKYERTELAKPGYVTVNPKTYKYIKEIRDGLKQNQTEAEELIWKHLRNKQTGYKIRRQHVIDDFIVDFVCLSRKVIIEIDGKIHLRQKEHDDMRTYRLREIGYEVIRFTNDEVIASPTDVATRIKDFLNKV